MRSAPIYQLLPVAHVGGPFAGAAEQFDSGCGHGVPAGADGEAGVVEDVERDDDQVALGLQAGDDGDGDLALDPHADSWDVFARNAFAA